ncbi:MAG: ABC transporter permease [Nitrospinota bacterium]
MTSISSIANRRARLSPWISPIASVFLLLFLWQATVSFFNVPTYLLPKPLEILSTFARNPGLLLSNATPSLYESISGFLLSVAIGIPLAFLTVWSTSFGRTVMPFLVFSQVVPKVAIAPLLLIWFGIGLTSKVLIVFMMAFFPIFISTISGLRAVDQDMLNMMNSMRPSKFQLFLKLRIPNSLPFLLDGLKLAVTRSVIAAVVAEWISSDKGLGYLIIYADAASDSPLMFGAIALLAAMGLGFFMCITAVGRLMIPWYFAMRKTEVVRDQKY